MKNYNKVKSQATIKRKVFPTHLPDKGIKIKIYFKIPTNHQAKTKRNKYVSMDKAQSYNSM